MNLTKDEHLTLLTLLVGGARDVLGDEDALRVFEPLANELKAIQPAIVELSDRMLALPNHGEAEFEAAVVAVVGKVLKAEVLA